MAAKDIVSLEEKSEIIKAIDDSSSKQLRELIAIRRILTQQERPQEGLTVTRRAQSLKAANDSGYKPNALGLRLKVNGENVQLDSQGNIRLNVKAEGRVTSERVERRRPPSTSRIRRQPAPKAGRNATGEEQPADDSKPKNKNAQRDSRGRFISDRTTPEAKDKMERERERKRNIKDQEGFWSRFGNNIREGLEDKTSGGDVGDMAGKAAGGVFWSAGKELYDVTANTSKSMYQFSKKFQREASNDDAPAVPKPVTRQPDDLIGSAKQLQEKRTADDARDEKKSRDETLKENERQTEILEELLDQSKKGAGGGSLFDGLASMFGGGKGRGRGGRGGRAGRTAKTSRFGRIGKFLKFGAGAAAVGAGGVALNESLNTKETKPKPVAKETAAANNAAARSEKKAASAAVSKGAQATLAASASSTAKGISKLIPGLGTVLSGAFGYMDEEGQNRAFGEGNVGAQQKASYAGMNILDFGGLSSMGFNVLADGAEWAGVSKDFTNKFLRVDPDVAAKQLDDFASTIGNAAETATGVVKSGWSSMMGFFSGNESQKAQNQNTAKKDEATKADKEVIGAVQDGASQTVSAINDLTRQLTKEGGVYGQDNIAVPAGGGLAGAVTQDMISSDLNIGGANAKVRSFRNNNFGNLNYVGQTGATLEDPNAAGEARFAKFATPEEGFRGLANQLSLYADGKSKSAGGKKLNSVEDIINLYAPANENNTKSYIGNLSKSLGVGKNDALDLSNPEVVTKMMRGIATIEGGNPQVTDDFIKKAIGQKGADGKWRGEFSDQSLTAINAKRAEKGLSPISKTDQYSNPENVTNATGTKPVATAAVAPVDSSAAQPAAIAAAAATAAAVTSKASTGVEGMRDPKSVAAAAKAVEGKKTEKSESTVAKDAKAATSWLSGVSAGVDNFAAGYTSNVEGLRDVKDTSGMMLPASMMKTGGSTSGQTVGAYDYGDPVGKDGKPMPKEGAVKPAGPDANGVRTDANGVRYTRDADKKPGNEPSFISKVAGTVVPSLADAFQSTIGGIDVGGMAGSALDSVGVDRGIQDRLSPITSKIYGYGDKAAKDAAEAGGNAIRSVQPIQESRRNPSSVTDLAASGVRTESERSRDSNAELVAQMKLVNQTLLKVLGETKGNKVSDPNVVTKTPQPQPKQAGIPLQSLDGAISHFLGE